MTTKTLIFFLLFGISLLWGNQDPLILITTPGKTGSSTLNASFRRLGVEVVTRHIIDPAYAREILATSQIRPVVLISVIRDPIARSISNFFQHATELLQMSEEEILQKFEAEGAEFLCTAYYNCYYTLLKRYCSLEWSYLGYDALKDASFDHQEKHQLFTLNNLTFLVLRFEDIAHWEQIISQLPLPLDLKGFTLLERNMKRDKWYRRLYEAFYEKFQLPRKQFDQVVAQFKELLAHFYTEEEVAAFYQRWEPLLIEESTEGCPSRMQAL